MFKDRCNATFRYMRPVGPFCRDIVRALYEGRSGQCHCTLLITHQAYHGR